MAVQHLASGFYITKAVLDVKSAHAELELAVNKSKSGHREEDEEHG